MTDEITKENVAEYSEANGGFAEYAKQGVTLISNFSVPEGTIVFTPEPVTVDESSRIALDAEGHPYPIREEIFRGSFERVPDAGLATIAKVVMSDDLDTPYTWQICGDLGEVLARSEKGWENPDDAHADLLAFIGRLTGGVIDVRDESGED